MANLKSLNGEYFMDTDCSLSESNSKATQRKSFQNVYGNKCIDVNSTVTHKWVFKICKLWKADTIRGEIDIGIINSDCVIKGTYQKKDVLRYHPFRMFNGCQYGSNGELDRSSFGRLGGSVYVMDGAGGFTTGDIVEMIFDGNKTTLSFMTNGINKCEWYQKITTDSEPPTMRYKMFVYFNSGGVDDKCVELLSYSNNENVLKFEHEMKEKNNEIDNYKDMIETLQQQMQQLKTDKESFRATHEAELKEQEEDFDVTKWLNNINLGKYSDILLESGFDDLQSVLDLTMDDLKEIGIVLGHRKKIMKAVVELRTK
eukprot:92181_1